MTTQDILTALDWMDEDGSAAVHCRNRIVSREAIDLWAAGHSWTAADVDGHVVVTRDDGVTANVWIDESGVLQAVGDDAEMTLAALFRLASARGLTHAADEYSYRGRPLAAWKTSDDTHQWTVTGGGPGDSYALFARRDDGANEMRFW